MHQLRVLQMDYFIIGVTSAALAIIISMAKGTSIFLQVQTLHIIRWFVGPHFSFSLTIRQLLVSPIFVTDWGPTHMESTQAPTSIPQKKWRIMKAISWNNFQLKYFFSLFFLSRDMAVHAHALYACSLSADRNQIVIKFGSFSLWITEGYNNIGCSFVAISSLPDI